MLQPSTPACNFHGSDVDPKKAQSDRSDRKDGAISGAELSELLKARGAWSSFLHREDMDIMFHDLWHKLPESRVERGEVPPG